MATVFIRARTHQDGRSKSYAVLYRMGGLSMPMCSAGSFRSKKEADARADAVRLWIAQGSDPKVELARATERRLTFREAWDMRLASLVDIGVSAKGTIQDSAAILLDEFGSLDPYRMSKDDGNRMVQVLIGKGLSPATVHLYYGPARRVLDFLEIEPNPLASKHVRLPSIPKGKKHLPALSEIQAMLDAMSTSRAQSALMDVVRFMDATGCRKDDVGRMVIGDVALWDRKVRVDADRGKSKGSRFVPIYSDMILGILEARVGDPDPSRRDELLFPELGRHDLNAAMTRACVKAGVVHIHPHLLRHRRVNLWFAQGMPPQEVSATIGHEEVETTLRKYTHTVVNPLDDAFPYVRVAP